MGEDTEVFGKEKKCPNCGEAVPESSSYCPSCGYDFGGGKQGPSPVGGWSKKTVATVALLTSVVLLVAVVFLAPSVFRPYLEPLPVVGPVVGRKIPDFEIVPSTRDPRLGQPVTLDASSVEKKTRFITSYRWDFDGDGSIDATGPEVTHQFDSTGPKEVEVTVANRQGREKIVICLLTVKPPLIPDFEISPSTRTPRLGQPVTLDASSVEKKTRFITSYRWDFDGDGSVDATGPEITHHFKTTGPKEIQVTVANRQGRKKTVASLLKVKSKLIREEILRAMVVWGDKEWQDTGITVEKGDRIRIEVISGKWDPGVLRPPLGGEDKLDPCGPEGYPWKTKEVFMDTIHGRITKFPFASLIGRIGEEPLHVGEEKGPFDSQLSGRLYLAMNDEAGAYGDNSGLVSVAIQKFSGPAEGDYPQVTIDVGSSKTRENYIQVPVEVRSSSGLAEVKLNGEKERMDGATVFSRQVKLYPGMEASRLTIMAVNEEGKAAKASLFVDQEIVEGELGTLDY